MNFRALLSLAFILLGPPAYAQVDCGKQPADVSPDIQQQFKGDVEGKAQVFTRLLGDVNLKGTVETSRSEIHQKYKDLDKVVIDRFIIWVTCQSIMQNEKLSPAEKSKLWIDIYRELRAPQKSSRAPSDLFNLVEMGPRAGQTSIAYLESILGVAKTTGARSTAFLVGGYEVTAIHLDRDNANGSKGTILRLMVKVLDAALVRSTPVILDGYWNPEGCPGVGPPICRQDILPLSLSGTRLLSDYIRDIDCDPRQEGGTITNTDPSYFCVRFAYGSTGFIERAFELDVQEQAISTAFSLLNNLDDPELYRLERDVIERFEQELGIRETDKWKKRDKLVHIINSVFAKSRVVGFSISVQNYEDHFN